MNTAIAVPRNATRSLVHAWRTLVVSLAIVIVVAASFLVGHATAGTSHTSRPAVPSHAIPALSASGQSTSYPCRVGKAC